MSKEKFEKNRFLFENSKLSIFTGLRKFKIKWLNSLVESLKNSDKI